MKNLKVEIVLPDKIKNIKIKKRRISRELKKYIEAVRAAERLNKLLDEVDLDEIEKEAEDFRKKFKIGSSSYQFRF